MSTRSWLDDANDPGTDFPLTHLPYAAFEADGGRHLSVAIGSHLLDLHACAKTGLLPEPLRPACLQPTLNALMAIGPDAWSALREAVTKLLHVSARRREKTEAALHCIAGAKLANPVDVRNYTDFYASIHHATRVGKLFRPSQPLLPNYKFVPIGYHGRASSLVTSETPIQRPHGQTRPAHQGSQPSFHPTRSLDYELELAYFIGQPNPLGQPVAIAAADRHLFGVSLLNDWSARDIQSWEYQPLGPFLGKSFATSISPWITPMEALRPFLAPMSARPVGDPHPLPYLSQRERPLVPAIRLQAAITTRLMRENRISPFALSRSSSLDLYWSPAQLVAHHTSNGCNLQTGDILATGTISGAKDSSAGCLLELTRNGAAPVQLPTGETRAFLEDGDEIILRGYCEAAGHPRIGLGECRGMVLPALRLATD